MLGSISLDLGRYRAVRELKLRYVNQIKADCNRQQVRAGTRDANRSVSFACLPAPRITGPTVSVGTQQRYTPFNLTFSLHLYPTVDDAILVSCGDAALQLAPICRIVDLSCLPMSPLLLVSPARL